jgi:hypothetical protein
MIISIISGTSRELVVFFLPRKTEKVKIVNEEGLCHCSNIHKKVKETKWEYFLTQSEN